MTPSSSSNVGTSGGYSVYTDRDTFYTALAEFTKDGDNADFQSDIVYNDDGEIEVGSSLCDYTVPSIHECRTAFHSVYMLPSLYT